MSKFPSCLPLILVLAACSQQGQNQSNAPTAHTEISDSVTIPVNPQMLDQAPFGLGREASADEVAAWDIDVKPSGEGLPVGRGTLEDGEKIYAERCAMCHGDFGEGAGRWPILAGGEDTIGSEDPVKTIGSYWPNLSTVYDYVYRAMPFGNAQSLKPDELHAVVAYLLDLNYLLEDEALSPENFASIEMPNADGFFVDDRPDTPLYQQHEPCMNNCKDTVEITMRARVLDVTPDADD